MKFVADRRFAGPDAPRAKPMISPRTVVSSIPRHGVGATIIVCPVPRLRAVPRIVTGRIRMPAHPPRPGQVGSLGGCGALELRHCGCNELSTSVDYRGCMRIRSAPKRGQRKIAKRGDLLCVWLDLLNHLDNPLQRRAAKFRQTHRARRVIPSRRTSGEICDLGTR
jgi:hypothetical protein